MEIIIQATSQSNIIDFQMFSTEHRDYEVPPISIFPWKYSGYFDLLSELENPVIDPQTKIKDKSKDEKENQLSTLSLKKLTPHIEISFEKDFMKEHLSVFREKYWNFIEFHRISSGANEKTIQITSLETREELQVFTLDSLISHSKISLTISEKNQFLQDLVHEEKMHEFIQLVVQECLPNDQLRLILISYKIWKAFVPYQEQSFSIEQLIKLSSSFAENLDLTQDSSLLHCKYEGEFQTETNNLFQQFLNAFSCTLLLVITGYFENPFFNEQVPVNDMKRSLALSMKDLNIEDAIMSPLPMKKRK